VVQVIVVDVTAETGQSIPSIVTVNRSAFVDGYEPVKVTSSPPTTPPNLGLIDVRRGVNDPRY